MRSRCTGEAREPTESFVARRRPAFPSSNHSRRDVTAGTDRRHRTCKSPDGSGASPIDAPEHGARHVGFTLIAITSAFVVLANQGGGVWIRPRPPLRPERAGPISREHVPHAVCLPPEWLTSPPTCSARGRRGLARPPRLSAAHRRKTGRQTIIRMPGSRFMANSRRVWVGTTGRAALAIRDAPRRVPIWVAYMGRASRQPGKDIASCPSASCLWTTSMSRTMFRFVTMGSSRGRPRARAASRQSVPTTSRQPGGPPPPPLSTLPRRERRAARRGFTAHSHWCLGPETACRQGSVTRPATPPRAGNHARRRPIRPPRRGAARIHRRAPRSGRGFAPCRRAPES